MDKYLILKSNGELEPNALILMGASTKRDDEGKIGMFGTGNKYALAYLLRNNYDLKIFSGEKPIEIMTEVVTLKDHSYKQVYINEQPTSITTELGKDWELWNAIRELYSNAVDEGILSFDLVDEKDIPVPSPESTQIVIKADDNLQKLYKEKEKYFLSKEQIEERVIDSDSYYGQVIKKDEVSPLIIYLNGIRINQLSDETMSIFDYNITQKDSDLIDERRIIKDFYKEYFPAVLQAKSNNEEMIDMVISHLGNNNFKILETNAYFQSKFMYDRSNLVKEKLREFYEGKTVVTPNIELFVEPDEVLMSNKIPDEAFQFLKNNNLITDDNLPESLVGKKKGEYLCREIEITDQERFNYNKAIEVMNFNNYLIPYPIKFVEFLEEQYKNVLGRADLKNHEILLSRVSLSRGFQDIINTLIEENTHIKHGVYDETRAMQDALIYEFSTVMVDRFHRDLGIKVENIYDKEIDFDLKNYIKTGLIHDFPKDILEKMMQNQMNQGNPADATVFEEKRDKQLDDGGFNWKDTPEGENFWFQVIVSKNFQMFFDRYPEVKYPAVDPNLSVEQLREMERRQLQEYVDAYEPAGELETVPKEIIYKILEYQGEQNNTYDPEIFEKNLYGQTAEIGGFDFDKTPEGSEFWEKVLLEREHVQFFLKYPSKTADLWLEFDSDSYTQKGDFENLPKEIFKAVVAEMARQGQPFDLENLEEWGKASFSYKDSKDGVIFWATVLNLSNFDEFYQKYPKFEQENNNPFAQANGEDKVIQQQFYSSTDNTSGVSMSEIKAELENKVTNELISLYPNYSTLEFNSFIEWMKVEYKNFLSISREDALVTLNRVEEKCIDFKSLIDVLRNNMDEYGSIGVYKNVSENIEGIMKNRWNIAFDKLVEIPALLEGYVPDGEIANLPKEIILKMLENQVLQGNIIKGDEISDSPLSVLNIQVFEKDMYTRLKNGGFDFEKSVEGEKLWAEVLYDKNIDRFFDEYPEKKFNNDHIQNNGLIR